MAILKKVGGFFLKTGKAVLQVEQHKSNIKWIASMIEAMKPTKNKTGWAHFHDPADHVAFVVASKKFGYADFETQQALYKQNVHIAYISFVGVIVAACVGWYLTITYQTLLPLGPSIAAMSLAGANMFKGSLFCHLLRNQQLSGVTEFLKTPSNYLPNPIFTPARIHFLERENGELICPVATLRLVK